MRYVLFTGEREDLLCEEEEPAEKRESQRAEERNDEAKKIPPQRRRSLTWVADEEAEILEKKAAIERAISNH